MTNAATPKTPKAEVAGAASTAADKPKPALQVSPEHFVLAEQKRNAWIGVIPAGTAADELDLNEHALGLVAQLVNYGDDVRLISSDRRTIIDGIVVFRSGIRAAMRVTQVVAVPAVNPDQWGALPEGCTIVEAGPDDDQEGWLVKRKLHGEEVILNWGSPIFDYQEAIRHLMNHASIRGQVPQSLFRPSHFG